MTIKVGVIASTYAPICKNAKKGTEIFIYQYLHGLQEKHNLSPILFASGDSKVNCRLLSLQQKASLNDPDIAGKYHSFFETAHIGYALSYQNSIDLYHVHIGNGETVLPFFPFIHKPILITLHYHLTKSYRKKLYSLFGTNKNVFFISISNSQRLPLPFLNYIKTIYHGIDAALFQFNAKGGNNIMWAGRISPEKGMIKIFKVIDKTKRAAKIFALTNSDNSSWFNNQFLQKNQALIKKSGSLVRQNLNRKQLIKYYQTSKLFLSPITWEEPFGMVMIESMACGTPVVAYARGSVPEIVKDGETGFIVNPSDNDIRGNWLIKKTGIEGLIEAVEKIYNLSKEDYLRMRQACRKHVEKHFTIKRMVNEYVEVYKELTKTG